MDARSFLMEPQRHRCDLRHAQKIDGRWVMGDSETYGIEIIGDGSVTHRLRCTWCGERSGALPFELVKAWGSPKPHWHVTRPSITYDPCSVRGCVSDGVDRHHFAPRNMFGHDADNWPVMPLCRDHHREWHSTMNGYRWNQKSVGFATTADKLTE